VRGEKKDKIECESKPIGFVVVYGVWEKKKVECPI